MPQARTTRVYGRERLSKLKALAAAVPTMASLMLALASGVAWAQPDAAGDSPAPVMELPTPVPAIGELGTFLMLAAFLVLLAAVTILFQRRARANS